MASLRTWLVGISLCACAAEPGADSPQVPAEVFDACVRRVEKAVECGDFEGVPELACEEYFEGRGLLPEACDEASIALDDCGTSMECGADFELAYATCGEVHRDAYAQCPENVSFCFRRHGVQPGNGCGLEALACLDGHDYSVTCTRAGGSLACTCIRDGQLTGRYLTTAGCKDAAYLDEAPAVCGFPPEAVTWSVD